MSLRRSVEPEILDHMPPDDARAVRARGDLKRVNAVIMQTDIMGRLLAAHWGETAPRTILDLGTGDGAFMLTVARRLKARWSGVTVTLLDRHSIVSRETQDAFAALGWRADPVASDVLAFLEALPPASVDIITTNLFLHHFTEAQLARLLELAARAAPLLVACEPRRNKFALRSSRLLWAIGLNEVILHDAIVSVRAGFGGQELSALWPRDSGFDLDEHPAWLFTHCFVARRRERKTA